MADDLRALAEAVLADGPGWWGQGKFPVGEFTDAEARWLAAVSPRVVLALLDTAADDFVREHVADILFDGMAEADPNCALCQRAVVIGAWKHFGIDPFELDEPPHSAARGEEDDRG